VTTAPPASPPHGTARRPSARAHNHNAAACSHAQAVDAPVVQWNREMPITWTVHQSPVAFVVLAEWTFRRRDDRLALRREQTDQGYQLVITESGRPRTFTFRDLGRLVAFQNDMEDFLVRTGWSLAHFAPDGRNGGDRRGMPRHGLDRRRWWTDVVPDEG
jgi:hypothetical protein